MVVEEELMSMSMKSSSINNCSLERMMMLLLLLFTAMPCVLLFLLFTHNVGVGVCVVVYEKGEGWGVWGCFKSSGKGFVCM